MNTCCDSSCRKSDLKLMGTENVIPFSSPRCCCPFWSLRPVVRFPFPHPEETPGMSDAPPPVWNLGPVVRFPFFFTLKRHQGCLMPHPLSGISGLWFDSPFLTLKAMFGRQSLIFFLTFCLARIYNKKLLETCFVAVLAVTNGNDIGFCYVIPTTFLWSNNFS